MLLTLFSIGADCFDDCFAMDIEERQEMTDPSDEKSEKEEKQSDEETNCHIKSKKIFGLLSLVDWSQYDSSLLPFRSHNLMEIPTPPPES